MPAPTPRTHLSLRLSLGQFEQALDPQRAASLAASLVRIAGVLCAYAAAEEPGNELLAQLVDVAGPDAAVSR